MQPTYLIFLGPPGAGKGTQAELLEKRLHLPHISSGELFREISRVDTPLAREIRSYIERGDLVPDELTIRLVLERLQQPDCQNGVVLDGFPRTVPQARALDEELARRGLAITAVINLTVDDEVLVERLADRWLCRVCGASYHMQHNPPARPGRCDVCGGELYQRADDQPETVRRRLEVYHTETAPLIAYYRERGVLKTVDGSGDIEAVHRAILDVLRLG